MGVLQDIRSEVSDVVKQPWSIADAQVVPENDKVVLAGGAKKLSAAMFYADLADSTAIAMYNKQLAAKLFKSYLSMVARVVRMESGEIRSFDGDRLMAVFTGDYKNTDAVRAAMKLKYAFDNVLAPKFRSTYEVFSKGTFPLAYSCGIDSGEVLVVRGGIRNNNDLVWIGRAPNVAAKLSALREGIYRTFITDTVFSKMTNEAKFSRNTGESMWEKRTWPSGPVQTIYRSSWGWEF